MPTQPLLQYFVITKSCSIFVYISTHLSKICLCGIKYSFFPLNRWPSCGFSDPCCYELLVLMAFPTGASAPPTPSAFHGNLGTSLLSPLTPNCQFWMLLDHEGRSCRKQTHLNKPPCGSKTSSIPKDDNNDLCRFN